MFSTAVIIEEDVEILLNRALTGKMICAFGIDGQGKYGQHDHASWFKIKSIDLAICVDDEELEGSVALNLDGYDSKITGLIMTDKNFLICMQSYLKNAGIDKDVLTWPNNTVAQGQHCVVLDIDVRKLLGWF